MRAQIFKELKNPYYLGDEVGLTQTLGWIDSWTSKPSAYAVAIQTTDDVVAAVNFARENNLRLVGPAPTIGTSVWGFEGAFIVGNPFQTG